MSQSAALAPTVPREIEEACRHCGQNGQALNGAYYRELRVMAKMTLTEMSKACGVSFGYLAYMEQGQRRFQPDVAATYERIYQRRRRAGEE